MKATRRALAKILLEGLGAAFDQVPGLLGLSGAFISSIVAQELSLDQKSRLISELEGRKDFEVRKEDVVELELKKPGFLRGMGHILIRTRSGEELKIYMNVDAKEEYEILLELMRIFKPDALRLV